MSTVASLRELPSVDRLVGEMRSTFLPRPILVDVARSAIDIARLSIEDGKPADPWAGSAELLEAVELSRAHRLVNATGVLLHTNFGRAPLAQSALQAMNLAAGGYTNLEVELASGDRGGRGEYVRRLLITLTGAGDALVVNNNAAAVLLALAATADGKSVPVARGELIEIGGSYRLPSVMEAGGAILIEVGTTNRTRLGDYTTAVQVHDIGAILKVHPSNYRIEGFTQEASISDLAVLAGSAGVPLIHDVGSGLLDHQAAWLTDNDREWLATEPAVRQSLESGSSLVTFSGDKLLGGPQAGIVVGSADQISRLRTHPLARALRIDGATDAALASTLEVYARGNADDIPFWRFAHRDGADLRRRLEMLQRELGGEIRNGRSLIGAGSVPGTGIETPQLVLRDLGRIYEALLRVKLPIATRRHEGDLIIDLRAVEDEDDAVISNAVKMCR